MKTLRNTLFISLLIALGINEIKAQDPEAMKKVEAAKIGIITERLGLTSEQAQQFWPIYMEFSDKRRAVRMDMMVARKGFDPQTATEEENKAMLDLGLQTKEKELQLEREYSERLLKVISTRQLVSLRQAEEDFRKMILNQLEKRARQQNLRERNQERINGKRSN